MEELFQESINIVNSIVEKSKTNMKYHIEIENSDDSGCDVKVVFSVPLPSKPIIESTVDVHFHIPVNCSNINELKYHIEEYTLEHFGNELINKKWLIRALTDKQYIDNIIDCKDEFTITRVPNNINTKLESAEHTLVLEQYLTVLFQTMDTNNNNLLNFKIVKTLFLSASLDLTKDELFTLFIVLNEDKEGFIDYKHFINIVSPLVRILKGRGKLPYDGALSCDQKELIKLYINYKSNFIYKLANDVFIQSDSTFTGYLPRFVFLYCLSNPILGLTELEKNIFMCIVEEQQDSSIAYNQFPEVYYKAKILSLSYPFSLNLDQIKIHLKQEISKFDLQRHSFTRMEYFQILKNAPVFYLSIYEISTILTQFNSDRITADEFISKASINIQKYYSSNYISKVYPFYLHYTTNPIYCINRKYFNSERILSHFADNLDLQYSHVLEYISHIPSLLTNRHHHAITCLILNGFNTITPEMFSKRIYDSFYYILQDALIQLYLPIGIPNERVHGIVAKMQSIFRLKKGKKIAYERKRFLDATKIQSVIRMFLQVKRFQKFKVEEQERKKEEELKKAAEEEKAAKKKERAKARKRGGFH